MNELEINLLSPLKQNKLKSLIKFLFVKEYLELIVFVASILAMAYLGTYFLLSQVVNDLTNSTLLVNRDFSAINTEIHGINKVLKSVVSSGKEYSPITPWLNDIAQNLPPDVRLTSFSVNRIAGTVSFSGVAASRESLLKFVEKLSTTDWINSPNIPRSQLFLKDNVPFEISALLKKGSIKDKKLLPKK